MDEKQKKKAVSASFDLCQLNTSKMAEEGQWLQLVSPQTGIELPSRIKLAGTDSDAFLKRARKVTDRRLAQQAAGGFRNHRTRTVDLERDKIDSLVSITLAWEGMAENGVELECTPENVKRIYSDPGYSWILSQVDIFAGDQANFIKS